MSRQVMTPFHAVGSAGGNLRRQPTRDTPKPLTGKTAADLVVPVGWARFEAEDNDRLAVIVELGDRAPRVTDGYGGWEEVQRRGRVSLTTWSGFSPLGIEIDVLFDSAAEGTSVEGAIDVLEALGGRGRLATGGEPPKVIVDTQGVMPHDVRTFPFTRWVITTIDWQDGEDDVIVNDHGNRILAAATVTLWAFTGDTRLQDRALAAKVKLNAKSKTRRTHTVKASETLMSIARAKLGDAGRWREIADLNDIRDPRAVKPGAVIRLP